MSNEIPLVWQDGVLIKKPDPSSFDERMRKRRLDRFMFERVRQAWEANWPLSPNAQAGDRYLPKVIAAKGEFSAKEAKAAMQAHIEAGNLMPDRKNARSSMGLRVVRDPFADSSVS